MNGGHKGLGHKFTTAERAAGGDLGIVRSIGSHLQVAMRHPRDC
jgi:hypothetical protein